MTLKDEMVTRKVTSYIILYLALVVFGPKWLPTGDVPIA